MLDLSPSQIRQLIDTEQVYQTFRSMQRRMKLSLTGSMSWKTVAGRRYLYRKKKNGRWASLGPESAATMMTHKAFHEARTRFRAKMAGLDDKLREFAPINRAMRLGRVPLETATVIRRLEREGVLGRGLKIVGTTALYAFERMAGVHFDGGTLATRDVDLLYDARARLDLIGGTLRRDGLIGVLRSVDPSFQTTAAGSFRAASNTGFLVDLITPASRHSVHGSPPPAIGHAGDDLTPVEIAGLVWLENSPMIERIVIDERGYPLTMIVPDPRIFAAHKLWLARRDDRDPQKRRRDEHQAREVAAMLQKYLPAMRFDDRSLCAMPRALCDEAERLASSLALARRDLGGWDD